MKKPRVEVIEEAIVKAFGNLTLAAKSLRIARPTLYKWIRGNKRLEEAIQKGRDERLDFAESRLDKLIQEGNATAIIFFLKTQGRERGYIERKEIEHSGKIQVPQWRWEDEEPEIDAGT